MGMLLAVNTSPGLGRCDDMRHPGKAMLLLRGRAMTTVLVLHNVSLLRSALVALLKEEGSFTVCSADWCNGADQVAALRPDVVVLDLDCPGGLAALLPEEGRAGNSSVFGPQVELLVMASPGRPGALHKAFEAGARGYVGKESPFPRLVRAILTVARGERFVDASLGPDLLEAAQAPLTAREWSVLARAAEGLSNAEIARGLHLANGTIRNYMASATRKIGARNRIDAIRIARQAGWV
ncbi:LuxR C-terminal-related transcriptional regulator [Streptomyces sp. NPDC058644]|uniref:response regulator transcription factor n=1 Tax=unclassified Streptomyces TaxID=2593676 RepID=UPI003661E85B